MIQMLPHNSPPSHSRHQPPPCARGRTGPTGRTGSLPSASPTPGQAPSLGPCPLCTPPRSQTGPPFRAWVGRLPPNLGLGPSFPLGVGPGL